MIPPIRSQQTADKKHHWFSAWGGGGSTVLSSYLANYASYVLVRPDLVATPPDFLPNVQHQQRVNRPLGLLSTVLDEENSQLFFERTGGLSPRSGMTIEETFLLLDSHVKYTGGAIHCCMLSEYEFFSRNAIPGVVFLIRHPVDGYASWIKPGRHLAYAELHGGVDATWPAEMYVDVWIRMLQEYEKLRNAGLNPILVRFEHAKSDAPPELATVFQSWDSSRRNPGVLAPKVIEAIEAKTKQYTNWLYSKEFRSHG